jgi:choline dehydrogenase-like flavoprotein
MAIIPATDLGDGAVVRTRVGIIGGGPAGLAVALRLAERGVDSVVCESGGETYDQRTQDLYDGDAPGYWDLTATRLRQLGGTTNHFSGQSRPLDPVDFDAAPWRPGQQWPISYDELAVHLPAATALMGLVDGAWEVTSRFDDVPEVQVPGGADVEFQLFQARPASFAATHRGALAGSGLITVMLGVNATSVVVNDTATAVDAIDLVTVDGARMQLVADRYVVATGGIESARLLLASTSRAAAGVGNSSGLVGRYFADHPSTPPLPLVVPPGVRWAPPRQIVAGPNGDVLLVGHLALSGRGQVDGGVPGFHARVAEYPQAFPDGGPGAGVAALVDPLGPAPEYAGIVNIGFDVAPNAGSAVVLSQRRNELGEPLAELRWRLSDDDEEMMAATVRTVARQLALLGVGRLNVNPPAGTWVASVEGQHHHMGTLRMSSSPTGGVVDTNQRFHDLANLYAAGSAVFPTYGHVNPTLNVVALSLRLGDHLAGLDRS